MDDRAGDVTTLGPDEPNDPDSHAVMSNLPDIPLDTVPKQRRKGAYELANMLRALAGDSLVSFSVYGRAMLADFNDQRDALESVAVLTTFDLDKIHLMAENGQKLGQYQVRAPLLMTAETLETSCRTFPLEMLEIQQTRSVVLGRDCFDDVIFDRAEARLQCGRELERARIHLRQGLLASGGQDEQLPAVTFGVLEQTLRVLRAMLWLWNQPCPKSTAGMISDVEQAGDLTLVWLAALVDRPCGNPLANLQGVYWDLTALAERAARLPV